MKLTSLFMGALLASSVLVGAAQAALPPPPPAGPPGSMPEAGLDYSDVHKVSETDIVGVAAQDLYDALDVRPTRSIAVKIAMHFTKSAGLLNCTKTSYFQKGISYSCTYAETDDVHMKFNSYRDIYNSLSVTPQNVPTVTPVTPPEVIKRKSIGGLSCDELTQPPYEMIGYSCKM